jgi:branched-chain amino acid aminotransferase
MRECIGQYFYDNGKFRECVHFNNEFSTAGNSYYEVMRVIGGVCIFIDDHLERLIRSLFLAGNLHKINPVQVKEDIYTFLRKSGLREGNIKVVVNFWNSVQRLYIFQIEHHYPGPEEYAKGVGVALFFAKRHSPNIKYIDTDLRKVINEEIRRKNVHEVLLVNDLNCITEGSRSNVFFVKQNTVYTSPDAEVLTGITRYYAIDICKKLQVGLIFRSVPVQDLSSFDAAFITGTSPKILPVNRVGDISFNPEHALVQSIMESYNRIIDNYILKNKVSKNFRGLK